VNPEPRRVLVVDDARVIRLFVQSVLAPLPGIAVVEASNGVEALERALSEPVHLLIVDVNMPKLDGLSLLRDVRRHPELRGIPAIVATTEDRPADRDRAYSAGANLHLPKPLDGERLRACVALLTGVRP
jgi:two-component system chemotaxis response regulator CheY